MTTRLFNLALVITVAFDAIPHAKGQLSLNDSLHTAINLIPDLFEILIGFREQAVAVTADIRNAFLKIQIAEEDQNYTDFFWAEDLVKEEEEIFKITFKPLLPSSYNPTPSKELCRTIF